MSQQNTVHWPTPEDAVREFYGAHLQLPLALFEDLQVKTPGSGRPAGQRKLLWSATFVLSAAALEAGLEELVFSAHGRRMRQSGTATKKTRQSLVENALMTPGPAKIEKLLESQFGIVPSSVPQIARFEARRKDWAKGGAGKGDSQPGPHTWAELMKYLGAIMHIRNGTAHGDVVKLRNSPANCEGLLWVRLQGGGWSMQLPHAITALRTIVSVFNTVAYELDDAVGLYSKASPLQSPNDLVTYA